MIQINDKLIPVEDGGVVRHVDLSEYEVVLESCFKKCGFHDSFLVDDILLAVSFFARKNRIESSGLEELLYRVLVDNGLTDVAAHFKRRDQYSELKFRDRIQLQFEKLNEEFNPGLIIEIEQKLEKAGYADQELSDSFLHAVVLEELRLRNIKRSPYRLGEGMLMPNQTFRSLLNLSADQVNWDLSQLSIHSGGYLFQSIQIEIRLEEMLKYLQMPPLVEMKLLDHFSEICTSSTEYLEKALSDFKNAGGEYDYISVKLRLPQKKDFKRLFKKSFRGDLEKILYKKYEPFADKGQLIFHID